MTNNQMTTNQMIVAQLKDRMIYTEMTVRIKWQPIKRQLIK